MAKTQLPATSDVTKQRIDRWLWHARVAKSRSLAQDMASSGRVRVNKERIKGASHTVRAGDIVTIAMPSFVRILKVIGFLERRGNAEAAQLTFEDQTPPPPPKTADEPDGLLKSAGQPKALAGGRPTKRARRDYEKSRRFD